LKDALGSNIYSIGVSLTIVGCSLMLSISSTLILLAIINEELKQHIKNENTPVQAMASSSQMKLNGVSPFHLSLFISAPCSTKYFTMASFPF